MESYSDRHFLLDLKELGIEISEGQLAQFAEYYGMLTEWNQKINLTAITGYEDVMRKHFVDSLSLVRVCNLDEDLRLIDVGTGAGFPGLVLKIAFPALRVTLLDSLNKRVQFLNAVIDRLSLKDIDTVHARAEDCAEPSKLREQFDLCVSRAVANLSTLSEYCLPFVRVGGCFVSYKSEKIEDELKNAENAINLLGGRLENRVDFLLPSSDIQRSLCVIRKVKKTPLKYPRKAGTPSREPL